LGEPEPPTVRKSRGSGHLRHWLNRGYRHDDDADREPNAGFTARLIPDANSHWNIGRASFPDRDGLTGGYRTSHRFLFHEAATTDKLLRNPA
jgi:hypothetical protein